MGLDVIWSDLSLGMSVSPASRTREREILEIGQEGDQNIELLIAVYKMR
jgi:hypothetical protein